MFTFLAVQDPGNGAGAGQNGWQPYTRPIPNGGEVVTIQGLEYIFKIFLNYAVRFAGLLVFIMLLVGGFKFLTAGGDKKAVEGARNTLTWAILGLVFLIAGWLILLFIREFTGVDVTQFVIPAPQP